jgi:hypothetical protein
MAGTPDAQAPNPDTMPQNRGFAYSHGGFVSRETLSVFVGVMTRTTPTFPVMAAIWSGSLPRMWVPDLSHGGWVPQWLQ